MIMVCVKQLSVVGGTESDLTIGERYSVSPIPVALPLLHDKDFLL